MKTIKNYLLEKDKTLFPNSIVMLFVWIGIILLVHHYVKPHPIPLNPPVEELNGYIPGTNQTWGQIR